MENPLFKVMIQGYPISGHLHLKLPQVDLLASLRAEVSASDRIWRIWWIWEVETGWIHSWMVSMGKSHENNTYNGNGFDTSLYYLLVS